MRKEGEEVDVEEFEEALKPCVDVVDTLPFSICEVCYLVMYKLRIPGGVWAWRGCLSCLGVDE